MSSYLLERPISSSSVSTTVSLESKGCRRRPGADAGVRAAQRAQFFKTRLCPHQSRGRCLKGDQCTYAHSDSELLPSVNLTKTKLCQSFMAGTCEKPAADCPFAHGVEELRATRGFYKTQTCKFWLAGYCPAGDKCRHSHGEQPRIIDMLELGRRSSPSMVDLPHRRVSMLPYGVLSPLLHLTTNNLTKHHSNRRRSVTCGLLAPAESAEFIFPLSIETQLCSIDDDCSIMSDDQWSRTRSVDVDLTLPTEDACFGDVTVSYLTDLDE